MEEKELKTSTRQRVFIILIAILMVGSIIASYAAIVISGSQGSSSDTPKVDEAKIAELTEQYEAKQKELPEASKADFDKFVKYKADTVKAYNEASANENGVQARDIEKGSGDKVTTDNYLAYYIGWCADETVFDSSLDNVESPTAFKGVLDPSVGLIEGWIKGVEGMRINGIREITVPGELAYGDTREICGGKNKPLKFMIMAIPREGVPAELVEVQKKLQYAYYGIDYDTVSGMEE